MTQQRVERVPSAKQSRRPRVAALVVTASVLLAFGTADTKPAELASADIAPPNTEQSELARPPLTIGVSGCSVIRTGAVCEVPVGGVHELKFWFPGAARGERPVITIGGRDAVCQPGSWLDAKHGLAESGTVVSCSLQTETASTAVSEQLNFELHGRTSILQLAAPSRWPWQAEIAKLANGDAIDRINALLPRTKDEERGRALSALAVRQTAVGDWRGACDTLAQSATIAERLGRYSESRHRWLVCAYQASEHYDFERAELAINRAADSPSAGDGLVDVEREAFVAYAWSFFHTKLGQYARAQAAYEQTIEWSRRGASELGERSAVGLAHLAAERGRYAEAISLLAGALRGPLARYSPCFQATVLHNLGRQELNAHWSRLGFDGDFEPWLTRAEEHLRQASALVDGTCATAAASDKAWIRLELGFVAWHHRQLAAARRLWTQAGPADGDGYYWAWRTILDAELALEEGNSKRAMTGFLQLDEFGETTVRPPMQWRAAEGLARVHIARSQWPLAIEHFLRAEQILTASEHEIPVENGLLGFTSSKARSAQGLVSALVHEGRIHEAFDVARVARRRALSAADLVGRWRGERGDGSPEVHGARASYVRSRDALAESVRRLQVAPLTEVGAIEQRIVEQREIQRASLEQLLTLQRGLRRASSPFALRAPDSREVLLLWFEANDGWHGFAQSSQELVHVTEQEPRGSDWLLPLRSLTWLGSFETQRQRLTILGFGKSQDEVVHTLPFEGVPLFERFDVAYGLDLEPREPRGSVAERVLLAADARGDLPLAAAEATRLERLYAAHDVDVMRLTGTELGAPAFRSALESSTVLHFAGHGQLAGPEGWDSWLELAGNTRFTAGDVLALPSVPPLVVLNACEAAANRDLAKGPGLGLAHAWILAGTAAVVAPTKPVADRDAYRFAAFFAQSYLASRDAAHAYRVALGDPRTDESVRAAYRMIRQ